MSKLFFAKKFLIIFFLSIFSYMAKEIRLEIKTNYNLYTTLLKKRKTAPKEQILIVNPKISNKNYLENIFVISHSTLPNSIDFIVTVKAINRKYFSFKLKCRELSEKPFFGYDSDGATHRNEKENIPLIEQMVSTPHFNYYDEDGQRMAYKSEKLKDEKETLALEDINLSIVHYCHEANVRYNTEDYPQCKFKEDLFSELDINDMVDPNLNVQFT